MLSGKVTVVCSGNIRPAESLAETLRVAEHFQVERPLRGMWMSLQPVGVLSKMPRWVGGQPNHRLEAALASGKSQRVISPDPSAPGPMQYAILGEDHSSTADKLAKYTGEVPWTYLAPHYQTGSLYFVDPTLELKEVGAAISGNQTERVKAWLKSGDLVKIDALHVMQWEDGETEFEALVISPFVLCRPL